MLADSDDLDRDQPFLVGPGIIASGAVPTASEHPPALPVIAPDPATADGNAFRRAFVDRIERTRAAHRNRFDADAVHVLMPDLGQPASHAVKVAFQERAGIEPVTGNPSDLPAPGPELTDPAKPWPAKLEDPIVNERWHAVLFGAGEHAWGKGEDLLANVGGLLQKLQSTSSKPRLRAVLPVLVVGALDPLTADEQRQLDARWNPVIAKCPAAGLPVIDLRPAQREATATAKRGRAAVLLAEGWRQVAALVARLKP